MINKRYFLGANTPNGFFSYFDEVTAKRVVLLKGGPGTGKSTLLKRLANMEGHMADVFYCSSDRNSLDGVLVDDLLVLDSTAPHSIDAKYPALVDEILNLGQFWDRKKIRKSENEILSLMAKKSQAFSECYTYLKAAEPLYARLLSECSKNSAPYSENILVPEAKNPPKKITRLFLEAYTNEGFTSFLAEQLAGATVIDLKRSENCYAMLNSLADEYANKGYEVIASYDQFFPGKLINHLVIKDTGFVYTVGDLAPLEREQQELQSQIEHLTGHAVSAIKTARETHMEIEKYYIEAMDFKGVNAATDRKSVV